MSVFLIKVYLPTGKCKFSGIFLNAWEAQEQARADWPEAVHITTLRLMGASPSAAQNGGQA